VSSLATPAATAVAATATPHQSPVISHSHRSSTSVTGHQPQSPVISLSHQSSATVMGQQHISPPSPEPALAVADVKAPPGFSAAALSAGREALPLQPPPPNIIAAVSPYAQLLAEFPQVVNQSKVLPTPSTEVEHHISTTGPPISSKFRQLDSVKLAAAKKEFYQMEKDGIMRRSDSPWSSPLHMVMKPDGSWRPCGDYRRLNLVTTKDSYPLPNMALCGEVGGLHHLLQGGLAEGIPSDPHARRRHSQDGHHYAVWAMGVPPDDLWPQERW
jgi:hypothetical protein